MEPKGEEELELSDELYEQFGKPLETEHWGEFVAIRKDGKVLLRASLLEAVHDAKRVLGPGAYVFKVGERIVGRWR